VLTLARKYGTIFPKPKSEEIIMTECASYLAKANQSLRGAESELDRDRFQMQLAFLQRRVNQHARELKQMVRARYPDVRFRGPVYWPDEDLWLISAYLDDNEDFELREQLSNREMDILIDEDIPMLVLLLPSSSYNGVGALSATSTSQQPMTPSS
jgi:hypothetical protein